jgi:hypothetical protein
VDVPDSLGSIVAPGILPLDVALGEPVRKDGEDSSHHRQVSAAAREEHDGNEDDESGHNAGDQETAPRVNRPDGQAPRRLQD